jgi:hypothetical protein
MKTCNVILVAALAMASGPLVHAEGSLAERRQALINGNPPGIVIWDGGRSAKDAPATAPAPAAAGTAGGTERSGAQASAAAPAAGAKPLTERLGGLFNWAPPPSGRPLNAARRLESPTQGIAVPTQASAASQPAGK